jgi:hypothetical protein
MAEPSLFQEGSLRVTRRRIIAEDQEYEMRSVTSVQIGTARLSRLLLGLLIAAGIVALAGAQLSQNLYCFVVPVAAFGVAGYLWWRASRTFILIIGTADGEHSLMTSNNRPLVDRAAQAIDSMLLERTRFGT